MRSAAANDRLRPQSAQPVGEFGRVLDGPNGNIGALALFEGAAVSVQALGTGGIDGDTFEDLFRRHAEQRRCHRHGPQQGYHRRCPWIAV